MFFICCSQLKTLVAGKRIYNHKTLRKKCQTLKDFEKGMRKKDVAAKYTVPNNTLSTWVKSKEKRLYLLEKGSNIRRQKLRTSNFQMVDKTIFNWFPSMQTQNVPL